MNPLLPPQTGQTPQNMQINSHVRLPGGQSVPAAEAQQTGSSLDCRAPLLLTEIERKTDREREKVWLCEGGREGGSGFSLPMGSIITN